MSAPAEALVVCSLCRQGIAPSAFEYHLRQAHSLFTYRGVRRSASETIEAILYELITPKPSEDAWLSLWHLARDQHGERAAHALAEILARALGALPEARRESIGPALAPLVADVPLANALADRPETHSRSLALSCLAALPFSAEAARCRLAGLLRDRNSSIDHRIEVLSRWWPNLNDQSANLMLDAFIDGLSRARAIHAPRRWRSRRANTPSSDRAFEELQENAKLSCPRCGVESKRAAMEQHLWNAHRLILDGLKTRDPWSLIEEWLDSCKASPQPELLERCRVAANKIDPDGGQLRLARLTLARGLADPDGRRMLLEPAREKQAACCPWCFGLVPVPVEVPIPHVNLRPGRLCCHGYETRTDDRGMRTVLEVRTPACPVYQGYRPEQTWTARGISAVVATPMVVLALLFACLWPVALGPPIRAVVCFLALGAMAFTAIRLFAALRRPSVGQILHYTWRMLVPNLCAGGFVADDALFLAGLARVHARVGLAEVDAGQLGRIIRPTEHAAIRNPGAAGYLASLYRLRIEKEAEGGNDPVPRVVELVARTFEGQLPSSFAQHLLEGWATKWWTPRALARLRILLCDRAFEAGFEVQNLLDLGQNAPALGTVLGTAEPRPLAALRLLWSLRATRPWDKLGDVKTVFQIAVDSEQAAPLEEHGDLLLYFRDPSCQVMAEDAGPPGPATIRLTTQGVWLQGVLFRIPPREVEVRMRSSGGQLILGRDVFRSPEDLEPLSRELERWFRYGFHEFLPGVDRVLTWQSPDRAAILRAWGAVPCPECGRHLLPRAGEVGIALDEKR